MIGSTLLNRYKIESELGKGGMGIVYKADDTLLNRAVAIKFLNTSDINTEGKSRLLKEAQAAAQLNHPNIVSIYDAGETDGAAFIVMEFVRGETLRKIETLNLLEAMLMAQQICLALEHAHSNGIIHRDLKLENIVITNSQILKLMDFGLAHGVNDIRMTEEGMLTGTLAYLAPELIQGQPASVQSDLYAFGILLYELLVGHAPFQGTVSTVLAQHIHGAVPTPSEINPQIPLWVDDLIFRLLSKQPENRPASAKEVHLLLEQKTAEPEPTEIYPFPAKPKHNLSAQLTSFIGREKETIEIEDALRKNRLVTLTGTGGTGKTRLSMQVAVNLLDQYPDGIWFIELASLTDPNIIPQTILTTLGISEQKDRPILQVLEDYFRNKKTLLVLDNCEHLIDASARIAEAILHNAPDLHILASSREALGVKGEMTWHVPSLTIPDINHMPDFSQFLKFEAIQLFIERAVLAKPNFMATKENMSSIAQICSRLDGIPLAIELAASRVKTLSVDQIAQRLDDRFHLLTGGSRTALPRQQTLRATIDWSYNLLSEQEKSLLRNLTVFSGGWTLEAAEQVCGQEGSEAAILDQLTQLVDKSLVNMQEMENFPRYRMLETTRQYANEKLIELREDQAAHNNHISYFLHFAESAEKQLIGHNQVHWLNQLEMDHDNFRTALEWSMRAGQGEKALRTAGALGMFWFKHSHLFEGRRWLKNVLEDNQGASAQAQVKAWQMAGFLAFFQQDILEARRIYTQNLEREQALGDKWGIAFSLHMLANIADWEGNVEKVRELHNNSITLSREINAIWILALAQFSLGSTEHAQGNLMLAEELYEESLSHCRELGEKWGIGVILGNLGFLMCARKDFYSAKKTFLEALDVTRELGDKDGMTVLLTGLAVIFQSEGMFITSARLLGVVIAKEKEFGTSLYHFEKKMFDSTTASLKESMGIQAYQKEFETGMTLTLEEAASLASRNK